MTVAPARGEELTLAVPYYSGYELFLRTLRSIDGQRDVTPAVLVVDDSPGGLGAREQEEIRQACARFGVRIVRNEQNLGMARTWNRCLDEAATDLVTIVHGDDELEPTYASEMVALARRCPDASALFAGARIIDEQGRPAFSFPDFYKQLLTPSHAALLELHGDRGLASLMRGNYIFCPSLCYRRSKLGDIRFDPRFRMVLDVDLTTRVLLSGGSLVGVPKQRLYHYRRHSENATQHLTKELTRFEEEAAFYLDIARRAERIGFAYTARVARRQRIVKLNLLFCIVRDALAREWEDCGRKTRLFRTLFL